MIAYAIEAATQCGLFAHVVVSTDDEEIAATARALGAEAPFSRPLHLADDHTPTVPVIAHAVTACDSLGWRFDHVCCIYPAVPFIQQDDVKSALNLLQNVVSAEYSFPITKFPSAIQRALRRMESGRIASFHPEHELTRTQDLEPAYYDAGQFYWGHRYAWLNNPNIHNSGVGLVIPNWRVVDIDTPEDWRRAETIHRTFLNQP